MRILTTTLCYPTPDQPDQGIFVQRRSLAVAAQARALRHSLDAGPDEAPVCVVAPIPWCPVLRADRHVPEQRAPLPATYPRMLSVPVLSWGLDGLAFASTLCRTVQQMRRSGDDVDLIDAHFEYPDGVGAWLAARRLGLPIVVTLRGKLVSLSRRPGRRAQIATMLRHADGLIAVSESLANLARKVAGRDLDIDVIPNGVDADVFCPLDRAQARAELGWEPTARYILCVGHYVHHKGFDRLLATVPKIRRIAPDVRVVLVGSARREQPFVRELHRIIQRDGTADAVTLHGPVDPATLNKMYNAADVCVNVSRSEGWCNTLSESLSVGTPVVAFDVGGNREQICSQELGLLVPDGDLPALARAVVAALSRRWNHVLIAAHGGARGWPLVGREVIRVFERVLDRHAAARSHAARRENPGSLRPLATSGGAL